jgi:hypothetical protein
MSIFDGVTATYPENFFNIQNPNSPWVSVQFRASNPSNSIKSTRYVEQEQYTPPPEEWEEITINPSNLFDKLSIEDEGGFYKLTLSLVDREFTRLENIIIRSINLANNVVSGKVVQYDELNVRLDNDSLQNLRIRFGYAETVDTNGRETYIDTTDFNNHDYADRVTTGRTVVRSPWIYFMINGLEMGLTDFGLQVTISAFSIESTLLDKVKILKVFGIYKNTPSNVFEFIKKVYQRATGKMLTVNPEDIPEGPRDAKGNLAEVVIELGSNMVYDKNRPSLLSLREFINIFCSKMTPKTFDTRGAIIDPESTNQSENAMTSAYSYIFIKGNPLEGVLDELQFRYPNPVTRKQATMRTYVWREYGKSIVKAFNVISNTNYAALNSPVPINDTTSGNMTIKQFSTKVVDDVNKIVEEYPKGNIGAAVDQVDKWLAIAKTPDDFALVSSSIGKTMEQGIKNVFHPIASTIVGAINDQVFNGTITIPGDPFYLFDDKVAPMEYAIKVIILRPGYINDKGEYSGSSLNMSYLSGYYLVKKITHTIDINGFNTVLDIMRSPLD